MTWINLGNPAPKSLSSHYQTFDWGAHACSNALPLPASPYLDSFYEILESRRSRREFSILTVTELSSFLWHTNRVQCIGKQMLGFPISQRPTPSAGAIHPNHLLLYDSQCEWQRYDPWEHTLRPLGNLSDALSGIIPAAGEVLDLGKGVIILLVAEPGMTFAKYSDACSLIWRDAGVLIGQMSLVAESFKMNFCPLGITGEPWASKLDPEGKLVGVGMAILGSRGAAI